MGGFRGSAIESGLPDDDKVPGETDFGDNALGETGGLAKPRATGLLGRVERPTRLNEVCLGVASSSSFSLHNSGKSGVRGGLCRATL